MIGVKYQNTVEEIEMSTGFSLWETGPALGDGNDKGDNIHLRYSDDLLALRCQENRLTISRRIEQDYIVPDGVSPFVQVQTTCETTPLLPAQQSRIAS